jgi:hypothetical protein
MASEHAGMKQLPALTGLRGLAAYSVLIGHALNFADVSPPALTALAYFGMSLFFVLSGFVITITEPASPPRVPVSLRAASYSPDSLASIPSISLVSFCRSASFQERLPLMTPGLGLLALPSRRRGSTCMARRVT